MPPKFGPKEIITALFERAVEQGIGVIRVYGDGTPPKILAEHYDEEVIRLPITLVIIDQDNRAICGEITTTGEKIWH